VDTEISTCGPRKPSRFPRRWGGAGLEQVGGRVSRNVCNLFKLQPPRSAPSAAGADSGATGDDWDCDKDCDYDWGVVVVSATSPLILIAIVIAIIIDPVADIRVTGDAPSAFAPNDD